MSWTAKVDFVLPLQKYSYFPSALQSFASWDFLKTKIWHTHFSLNPKLLPKELKLLYHYLKNMKSLGDWNFWDTF